MAIALIALVALFLFLRGSSPNSAGYGTDPNAPPPAADSPYAAGPNAASGGTGDVGTWNGTPVPEKTAPPVALEDKQFGRGTPTATIYTDTRRNQVTLPGVWRGVPAKPLDTFRAAVPLPAASVRTATAADFPTRPLSAATPWITAKPGPFPAAAAPRPMLQAAAPSTFTQQAAPSKLQLVTKTQPAAASPIRLQKPNSGFTLR